MLQRMQVIETLKRWRQCGEKSLSDGTYLICRTPHVAPEAWLHYVFGPVGETSVNEIISDLPEFSKFSYLKLLREFNGLDLFSSNFFLFGYRASYDRQATNPMPWELQLHDREAKLLGVPVDSLTIGGGQNGHWGFYYVEKADGSINALNRAEEMSLVFEWPSLDAFLFSEIERLSSLFDDRGLLKKYSE